MTDSDIDRLSDEVLNLIENKNISESTEEKVNKIQNDIQTELDEVRERGAKRDFYLQKMDEKLRKYRDTDEDYDTKPCTCPSPNCPLKDGRIPAKVDMTKGFNRGIAEFRQTHRGQPQILDEVREDWREKKARIKAELRRVIRLIHADDGTPAGSDGSRFVET